MAYPSESAVFCTFIGLTEGRKGKSLTTDGHWWTRIILKVPFVSIHVYLLFQQEIINVNHRKRAKKTRLWRIGKTEVYYHTSVSIRVNLWLYIFRLLLFEWCFCPYQDDIYYWCRKLFWTSMHGYIRNAELEFPPKRIRFRWKEFSIGVYQCPSVTSTRSGQNFPESHCWRDRTVTGAATNPYYLA